MAFETFWHDVRHATRMLRRSPAFTATAVITLALGIGANSAIFSVVSGVLLRPLPYPSPDRLAMVWMDNSRIDLREDWHSFPDYLDYKQQNTTFEDMANFNSTSRTLTGDGAVEPERVLGAYSSYSLFDVLGVHPARGRAYSAAEDKAGANSVVILSHGLWQSRFGGKDDVLGRTLMVQGRAMQIIGVMPEGFAFPSKDTQFWIPTGASDQQRANRGSLWLKVIGRMKPGVAVDQAQADLAQVNANLLQQFPGRKGYGVYVNGYIDHVVGKIRPAILVLLGAVACVLLIACTNVANLLLARASVRERELALRAAIGAGRGRLVRQLLTESLLIGLTGGVIGVALAKLGVSALIAIAPRDLPRLDAISMDWRVLGFTALLSLATSVVFGLIPALQLARTDAGQTMKEGARGSSALGKSLRRGLIVVEMALAVVLLIGAGLMVRSFDQMRRVDLGFAPERLLTGRVVLWGERYGRPDSRVEFFQQVIARAKTDPAVEGMAAISTVFLSATPNSTNFSIEGRPDFLPENAVEVPVDSITPDYFRVMGVPLLQGRFFDERDASTAPPSVIINKRMADRFWPKGDALGHRIKYGQLASQGPWMTIVGIVADTRRTGYDAVVRPETYLPHAQSRDSALMMVIRTTGDPEAFAPTLRAIVKEVDSGSAVQGAQTMESQLGDMTAQRRLNTLLLSLFGIVAAILAAVGIYGVIMYSVQQRTRELGVRIALGAPGGNILRLVATEVVPLAIAGLILGLGAAFAAGRSMTSMLYEVSATDPATFGAICAVAFAIALLASLIPALRAVRLDPIKALRIE